MTQFERSSFMLTILDYVLSDLQIEYMHQPTNSVMKQITELQKSKAKTLRKIKGLCNKEICS